MGVWVGLGYPWALTSVFTAGMPPQHPLQRRLLQVRRGDRLALRTHATIQVVAAHSSVQRSYDPHSDPRGVG